jgi:hypothetical protein
MSGYWDLFPRGIWKISDPLDVLNALRDSETRVIYDASNKRVNLFGPTHKAMLFNMDDLEEHKNTPEYAQILQLLVQLRAWT